MGISREQDAQYSEQDAQYSEQDAQYSEQDAQYSEQDAHTTTRITSLLTLRFKYRTVYRLFPHPDVTQPAPMKLATSVVSLILMSLLMFSCGQAPQRQEKNLNRQQIEQLARIQLPPSSKEMEVHTESGIDSLIVLRFTLDQRDLDTFLTSAGYTDPLKEGFRPFSSQELRDVSWWNPDEAKDVIGGFLNTSDWASEVMVDVSASQPVVYLKSYDL